VSKVVVLLWIVVLVELISPVPAVLSFGAAYVLLARPPWFLRLVEELYSDGTAGSAGGDDDRSDGSGSSG
jgi:hypothetical protein